MKENQKKNSGSSLVSTLIASICIIIYLLALVQGAVRFYMSIEQRRIQIVRDFDAVANLAVLAGSQSFLDDVFTNAMNNAVLSKQSIEAIIISSPQGAIAVERQRGRVITWINNAPRFINRFGVTTEGLHRALSIQDMRNVTIQAAASTFNFSEFTGILKETLLIILAGFILAFFTMLIQLLTSAKVEEKVIVETAGIGKKYNFQKEEDDDEAEIDFDEAEEETALPKGLYSPRSNLGWEEYIKDRLESELHRCASTENDLTLLEIDFTDRLNDMQFKQAADEVVSFFTSRDLLFERGRQGITVIYPGVDLKTGLEKAQGFHKRISEKIFFNHNTANCIFIGLTSRAGRLLNAGRMLMEAHEALQRAKSDHETNIIAFKSDLEKYRKFIAAKSRKDP